MTASPLSITADPSYPAISDLLERFGRFGVDLGLERILHLLDRLGNPQQRVPIIHVAGTNGKGSVCAYGASVLTQAGYRVGRYTSPHLVHWCERICINEQPISPQTLLERLHQVVAAIDPAQPSPTQFEVFTAAAWLHFATEAVDLAVMEVGLGGRLDATNVVDTPLVSVITSLSREHWQRLGPTLADIAREKAGVLKPGRPAVMGPLPPEAAAVVQGRIAELNCPALWVEPAVAQGPGMAVYGPGDDAVIYPLPLLGEHQLVNSALAIAALQQLQAQGWAIPTGAIVSGMAQAQWPGRLQWVHWLDKQQQPHRLLIDGAHNPAAAQGLRCYVDGWLADQGEASVLWLMGMLDTKDHQEIFEALLRSGDHLHLVPVPGHLSAAPADLAAIAQAVCPDLAQCVTHGSLSQGLEAIGPIPTPLTVLCGSLYLIGDFLATEPLTPQ